MGRLLCRAQTTRRHFCVGADATPGRLRSLCAGWSAARRQLNRHKAIAAHAQWLSRARRVSGYRVAPLRTAFHQAMLTLPIVFEPRVARAPTFMVTPSLPSLSGSLFGRCTALYPLVPASVTPLCRNRTRRWHLCVGATATPSVPSERRWLPPRHAESKLSGSRRRAAIVSQVKTTGPPWTVLFPSLQLFSFFLQSLIRRIPIHTAP